MLRMQRSMATRIFASLVAVWFGFVTIQPLYSAPCPHHQPALAALAQGLGSSAAAPHSMAEHGTHGLAGHEDRSGGHGCHCIGACCGAAPVAVAQQLTEWVPTTLAEQIGVSTTAPLARAPRESPPHSLPFATAPPPSLLA